LPGNESNAAENTSPATQPTNENEEVIRALLFLRRQSLDEYRLAYPPKDNAYYYFTRLLDIEPGRQKTIDDILEIADRYSFLAEQSMINDKYVKAAVYVDNGLHISPDNESLIDHEIIYQVPRLVTVDNHKEYVLW